MNAELTAKALAKVGNPNILINLISQRVRQLNAGAGGLGNPLVLDTGTSGLGDIALREIIEGKMGWEIPELVKLDHPKGRKRKKYPQRFQSLR
jgi:DNA-directed RNA polymerase subunit omega